MAWELHSQMYSWAHAVISMTESRLFLIVPRAQRFLQILFVEIGELLPISTSDSLCLSKMLFLYPVILLICC